MVVDNTFLSPALQQPLNLGADIVIHSTTKYINGHSDVVGGAVIAKTQELFDRLKYWANCLGLTASPFDAYLTLRGLRTLKARLNLHLANTKAVVRVLGAHAAVQKVYYPGLKDHPGHAIAVKQQSGFGAMISFELKDTEEVKVFLDQSALFFPGGIPGRRGKPGRAPGQHDPCLDGSAGAADGRHQRRPAASFGRHRGRR